MVSFALCSKTSPMSTRLFRPTRGMQQCLRCVQPPSQHLSLLKRPAQCSQDTQRASRVCPPFCSSTSPLDTGLQADVSASLRHCVDVDWFDKRHTLIKEPHSCPQFVLHGIRLVLDACLLRTYRQTTGLFLFSSSIFAETTFSTCALTSCVVSPNIQSIENAVWVGSQR